MLMLMEMKAMMDMIRDNDDGNDDGVDDVDPR